MIHPLKFAILSTCLSGFCIAAFAAPPMSNVDVADSAARAGSIVGKLHSTFDVVLPAADRRVQVKVYAVRTGDTTTLAYIPPVEVDVKTSLVSYEQDGSFHDVTLKEFSALVQQKSIPADTVVSITLEVRLADSLATRRAVIIEAHGQGNYDLSAFSGDQKRLIDANFVFAKCQLAPVRQVEIELSWPGLPTLTLTRSVNPALSSRMTFKGQAQALFVERMMSQSGVDVQAVFYPIITSQTQGSISRDSDVNDFVKRAFNELGKAGTTVNNDGAPAVFINRDVANHILRHNNWKDEWRIDADDLELLNSLLQTMPLLNLDIFTVSQDEADEMLKAAYDWAKLAEEPGFVTLVDKLASGEQLNESDKEWLHSRMHTFSKSSGGGGGLSIGPLAFGGGSSSSSAGLDASTDQGRDYAKAFKSWLNKGVTSGKIPVPPSLKLVRLDEQKLQKQVKQRINISMRAVPYVAPASFATNTMIPSIRVETLNQHLDAIHQSELISDSISATSVSE